jgi:hypothetical protein
VRGSRPGILARQEGVVIGRRATLCGTPAGVYATH